QHAHGGKGHQPVGPQVVQALADQISKAGKTHDVPLFARDPFYSSSYPSRLRAAALAAYRRATSGWAVSDATMPSASVMTRLLYFAASLCTSSCSWVTTTTVMLTLLIASNSCMMSMDISGSMLPVGSSAMMILGPWARAR